MRSALLWIIGVPIPLILLIFPALFVVLLYPLILLIAYCTGHF